MDVSNNNNNSLSGVQCYIHQTVASRQKTLLSVCKILNIYGEEQSSSRSRWLRGLRRRSAARSPAEITGSNPAGGMDVCLL